MPCWTAQYEIVARLYRYSCVGLFLLPLLLVTTNPAWAERDAETVQFGFESPDPSWLPLLSDGNGRIANQARVQQAVHSGTFSEHVRIRQGGGTKFYLAMPIGQAPVIAETSARLWVRADRPGLQLLLRVVLPRSLDPATGQPLIAYIGGSLYQQTGHWQQLTVDNVPQAVERQTRVLRAQYGSQLDSREAFVDRVIVNAYGGPGDTNLWLDDLEIGGIVRRTQTVQSTDETGFVKPVVFDEPPIEQANRAAPPAIASAAPKIRLHGSTLLFQDRPVFPRIIQYQGESFTVLREIGFNAVWLPQPATVEQLREAAAVGMWLICPPPTIAPGERIGPQYHSVLAWHLGENLAEPQVSGVQTIVERLRVADAEVKRPIVCRPDTELRTYSRLVDIVVTGRNPLGTTLSLADYATWLRERPRRARPGSTVWSLIATEPAIVDSWPSDRMPSLSVPTGQIRRLVYLSLAAGSRGLFFNSHVRLDNQDPASRCRALQLTLLNEELQLIEAWAAAGSFVTPAQTSDPHTTAAVLQTERARLLLPIELPPNSQFVAAGASDPSKQNERVSFVVPGVPASNDAYELSPAHFRPLPHRRVTGGIGLSLPRDQAGSLVVLTQDALVINQLSRRVQQSRQRASQVLRELAGIELREIDRLVAELPLNEAANKKNASLIESAKGVLQVADRSLAQQDYQQAYRACRTALASIADVQNVLWSEQQAQLASPMQTPLSATLQNLPSMRLFARDLAGFQYGNNMLPAGEMESLDVVRQSGWRHYNLPQQDVRTDVELSTIGPQAGRSSLHLSVQPVDANQPGRLIEAPPVWVTSPAMSVQSGQLFEIRGAVRVPNPIQGSVDGLLVIDSLGGPANCLRLGHLADWQPFTLYRQAAQDGTLSVTFALSGIGDAWIDNITVRPVLAAPPVQARRSAGPPRR